MGLAEDRAVNTEGVGVVLVRREVGTLGYCHSELEPFYFLFFLLGLNRVLSSLVWLSSSIRVECYGILLFTSACTASSFNYILDEIGLYCLYLYPGFYSYTEGATWKILDLLTETLLI